MKKHNIIGLGVFILANSLVAIDVPNVRLTVRAVTPDGVPVAGADVGMGGGLSTPDGRYPRKANGQTDDKGDFTAVIACRDGIAGAFARSHGYYEGDVGEFRLYRAGNDAREDIQNAANSGRWEPWEQTIKIVIRPIKNPVPMYAKRVFGSLPARDAWIGYDLETGDWVSPYGKGAHADFELFYEGKVESNYNYDGKLSLRLPGAGNGIQALEQDKSMHSKFRMPYEAPQEGYVPSWSWRNARSTEKSPGATSTFVNEEFLGRNFIFRVRSVLDAEGKLVRARYGKIHSPFLMDPRGENGAAHVEFTYYLNPDETRNLEFDPKRNLFPGQDTMAP